MNCPSLFYFVYYNQGGDLFIAHCAIPSLPGINLILTAALLTLFTQS